MKRSIALATAFLLLALTGLVSCASQATEHASAPPPGPVGYWTSRRLIGASPFRPPDGVPHREASVGTTHTARGVSSSRVGALFLHGASGNHFCTASVVDSPGKDLIITAAHCINGGESGGGYSNVVFIPGYHDGIAPFGQWSTKEMLVSPKWETKSDPDYDVGFVILQPRNGKQIQDVLGANHIVANVPARNLVKVTGYPSSQDEPITCMSWTSAKSATQQRFDCPDFSGGTSGSPWVTNFDPTTRTGDIIGVIGGYEQGGDTDDTSYSVRFNDDIMALYRKAVAAEPSSSPASSTSTPSAPTQGTSVPPTSQATPPN